VPLLLSVTALNEPTPPLLRTTTPPEAARLFPLASFACTVIVEVALPLAVIDVGLALIVVVAADAVADAETTTLFDVALTRPPEVNWIVIVPATLCCRFVNVATPPLAVAVTVP